jgi:hypothetical protein
MLRLVAAELVLSLAVLALQEVPRGHGAWTLAGVAVLLASLAPLCWMAERRRAPPGPAARKMVLGVLVLFAVLQAAFAAQRIAKPKVIDLGTTTVAALAALAHGGNPYTLPIDPLAGGIAAAGAFHGYKYLPVMLAAYAPLALPWGVRGLVATNVVLQGATALALARLAAPGGALAALAAAAIYLSLPFPAYQAVARGANDLVPVLLLLGAFLAAERRPFVAGLLAGLSLAAKPMPAAAALLLVPGRGTVRPYLLGVLCGLVPVVPFALAAPHAVFTNIVLFNLARPIDDTSWLFGLAPWAPLAARAAVALALLVLYARSLRAPPPPLYRLALAAAAILSVFAVGPDMHHNYYLWFIPLFAVLASRAALGEAEGGRGRP